MNIELLKPQIIEWNKKISLFMGWHWFIGEDGSVVIFYKRELKFIDDQKYLDEYIFMRKYHEDFNKLMSVVELFETMDYGFKMCRKVVEVYIDSTKEVIIKTKETNRLDSLYSAVCLAVEYHNNKAK